MGDELEEGLEGDYVLQVLCPLDDLTEEPLELLYPASVDGPLTEVLEHPAELVKDQPIELILLVARKVSKDDLGEWS